MSKQLLDSDDVGIKICAAIGISPSIVTRLEMVLLPHLPVQIVLTLRPKDNGDLDAVIDALVESKQEILLSRDFTEDDFDIKVIVQNKEK